MSMPDNTKAHNVLGLATQQAAASPPSDDSVSPLENHGTYLESRSPTIASVLSPIGKERVKKQCRFSTINQEQEHYKPQHGVEELEEVPFTPVEAEKQNTSRYTETLKAFHLSRAATNLSIAPREEAPTAHKYVFRRPRALQVKYMGQIHSGGDSGINSTTDIEQLPSRPSISSGSTDEGEDERRSTDYVETQRERIELFIDLLFIGIISNISEHFFERVFGSETSVIGSSVGEFILLFLPSWRIWSALQQFLSAYYLDDAFQRTFIIFVLGLSLIWGNNAPYFLGSFNSAVRAEQSHFAIATYLIAISSIHLMEIFYSIWIPFIRRLMLVMAIATIPSLGLWIGVVITEGNLQVALASAALATEFATLTLLSTPLGDKLQGGSSRLQRSLDATHTRRRYETFFLIALGEGVFLLIRASPLGEGWSQSIGAGVLALFMYFLIHFLYFNGDHTRVFIHALHRRWWVGKIWFLLHIAMYASLVLMSSAVLYLVEYVHKTDAHRYIGTEQTSPSTKSHFAVPYRRESLEGMPGSGAHESSSTSAPAESTSSSSASTEGSAESTTLSPETLHLANAMLCITLAIFLFTSLVIALLNRPLDAPGTLTCGNRYARLAPRAAATAVFASVWVVRMDAITLLGIIVAVLFVVYIYEQHTGLERGWGFFEPSIVGCDGEGCDAQVREARGMNGRRCECK